MPTLNPIILTADMKPRPLFQCRYCRETFDSRSIEAHQEELEGMIARLRVFCEKPVAPLTVTYVTEGGEVLGSVTRTLKLKAPRCGQLTGFQYEVACWLGITTNSIPYTFPVESWGAALLGVATTVAAEPGSDLFFTVNEDRTLIVPDTHLKAMAAFFKQEEVARVAITTAEAEFDAWKKEQTLVGNRS